jgi:hypothetical protein
MFNICSVIIQPDDCVYIIIQPDDNTKRLAGDALLLSFEIIWLYAHIDIIIGLDDNFAVNVWSYHLAGW